MPAKRQAEALAIATRRQPRPEPDGFDDVLDIAPDDYVADVRDGWRDRRREDGIIDESRAHRVLLHAGLTGIQEV